MSLSQRSRIDRALVKVFSSLESPTFVEDTAYALRDAMCVERCGIWMTGIQGTITSNSYTTDLPEDFFDDYLNYFATINPIMPRVAPLIVGGDEIGRAHV